MTKVEVLELPRTCPTTGKVDVSMRISPVPPNARVAYSAAPPADRRVSFSGSGLPFSSAKAALESPRASRGVSTVELDGTFSVHLASGMPGSYYAGLGTTLVAPCVHVTFVAADGSRVRLVASLLTDAIPHRTLNHPPARRRMGAAFYADPLARDLVRSQDQILRDSAWKPVAVGWHGGDEQFWARRPRN